jgi:hypothetical protein
MVLNLEDRKIKVANNGLYRNRLQDGWRLPGTRKSGNAIHSLTLY